MTTLGRRRHEEIDKRVHERYAVHPGQRHAFSSDPLYHLHVSLIRDVCHAVEESLSVEGLDEVIRDRVQYRLLYGEHPEGITPPDFREAQNRMIDRMEATRRLMSEPLGAPGLREETWRVTGRSRRWNAPRAGSDDRCPRGRSGSEGQDSP